jgi:hypothetical protein
VVTRGQPRVQIGPPDWEVVVDPSPAWGYLVSLDKFSSRRGYWWRPTAIGALRKGRREIWKIRRREERTAAKRRRIQDMKDEAKLRMQR